jgi:hypothetical protein
MNAPNRLLGADDPDQLIGALAGWLADAAEHTATHAVAAQFGHYVAGHPTREPAVWMSAHIAERIAALLDADRGQP